MLDKSAFMQSNNIRCNPVCRQPCPRKSAVQHDQVILRHDNVVLVPERRRKTFDQIEEPFAPLRDMGAVLDIVRRPKSFGRFVVAFVESVSNAINTNALLAGDAELIIRISGIQNESCSAWSNWKQATGQVNSRENPSKAHLVAARTAHSVAARVFGSARRTSRNRFVKSL